MLETRDIDDLRDTDEVLEVQFVCSCGEEFESVPVRSDGLAASKIADICESRCGGCGRFSDFSYFSYLIDYGGLAEPVGEKTPTEQFSKRAAAQERLTDELSRSVRWTTNEKRRIIAALLANRRLRLRFQVRCTT